MNNKKILSFILSIMMLLQVLATPIEAAGTLSQSAKSDKSVSEGTFIDEKTQVFTFANTNQSSEAAGELRSAAPRRLKLFAPVPATSKTEKATISLDMIGIETDFDWTVFGNANAFKAWIAVQYKGETGFTKVSQEVSIDANHADPINVDVTVDAKKQVEYYSIVTEYDNDASRFKIRAAFSQGAPVSSGEPLNFDLTVVEMVNTKIQYEYLDEYGNVTTEDAPTTNLTNLAKFGTVDFDAKTSGEDILWKTKSLDPFDYQDKTIQLTVNKDNFQENNVSYKVTSNYDYKTGGKITITRQKDVVVPPTKDDGSGDPVNPANGYVRLTFDANENKTDGITGTHTAGAYAGKQKSYIDVKQGLNYDNANLQAAIKALSTTGTKEVNGQTKTYAQDAKNPWTPAVPTDTTPVAEKTYNAQYAKSAAEQVTELGVLKPVTIKVWKGDKIDWADGVAPATTNSDDSKLVQGLLDNAKVTDQSSRSSANSGKFEGKLKISFDDGSSLEVDKQMLIVSEHVVTVDPNNTDPDAPKVGDLPRDKITVIFKKGEGIANIDTKGKKTYAKPNATLADKDFPTNITYKDGYKNEVTWTPTDHKVDTSNSKYYNNKTNTFIFTASAKPGQVDKDPKDTDYIKLTFNANGGKIGQETTKDTWILKTLKFSEVTKPEAKKENATFNEWQDKDSNGTKIADTATFAKDTIVYANYTDKPGQQKSTPPSIDQPMDGDTIVTGIAKPNAEVEIKLPDGTRIITDADQNGRWKTPDTLTPLKAGEKVTAKATERGKTPSDEVWAYVSGNLTLTLDENYRGGEITHYDVYQGELIERYLYTPRRRGYVFEGWSYNSRRLDEVRPGDGIYYPTTLYAIWSKQKAKDDEDVEPVDTREVGEHKAYMFGYTDGTVRPNGYITRAEAAALVTRLLGLDTFASAAEPAFTDTPSSWYNKAINAAVNRGIMKGYPDKSFRPNAPITRAEFTQMISTIDNKPYGVAPFADVVGHWAERPIGSEYQAGRIKGYPDGTFRPNAFITRAEAVVILNKIFERNYDAMSAINAKNKESIKRFIDLTPSFWGFNDMVEATNTHLFKRRVKGSVQEDWVEVK